MPITQSHRPIAVGSPLGEDVLVLQRMTAREALSRLFEFQLDLLSENNAIPPAEVLGQAMTVRLELLEGGTRYFNGLVTRFWHLGPQGRYTAYRATLQPWLWLLTRTATCRIFQNQTVPAIIKDIFQQRGLSDFEERLSAGYRTREYCVQYRETDFNFISRLLELEGIYYYFQHIDGKHTLILADSYSAHETTPGCEQLPYFPPDTHLSRREHVTDWMGFQQLQPGACALNDFDFTAPKKKLLSRRNFPRSHAQSDFEIYDYPGGYVQSADGESYARVRIEELQAQYEQFQARTNARGLAVGALFKLVECPRPEQNREYLVVSTEYTLQSDAFASVSQAAPGEEFTGRFTALEAQQPYRPLRRTPKPIVQGPQTAIVVGKAGEEIWTDQYGRVKCQFHWDREGQHDENSSCWIRVSHPWAGKGWGAVSIPRIGQEVIVDFLEGDPDQPIITGRVYNADSMPPFSLPAQAVVSGIKSSTHKGSGYNEMTMDDTAGKEKINTHAQFDMTTTVEHDQTTTVNNNRSTTVVVDDTLNVNANRTVHVTGKLAETIDAGQEVTISSGYTETITGGATSTISGGLTSTVNGTWDNTVNGHLAETVTSGEEQNVTGGKTLTVTGGFTEDVTGERTMTVSGPINQSASATIDIHADGAGTYTSSASLNLAVAGSVIEITPAAITISAGGSTIKIDAAGVAISGAKISLNG